ncbi:MAG: nuclear transport factor 2 family protein [Solirubrobacterales bacterium]
MKEFRSAVEAKDFDAVPPLLAEDAIFRSPVVFKPFEGKQYVTAVLLAALRTLEDFHYVADMTSEDGRDSALVFKARVGESEVHGCDFIHLNDEGLIDEFAVMIRPLSAVQAVGEAMMLAIAKSKDELGV